MNPLESGPKLEKRPKVFLDAIRQMEKNLAAESDKTPENERRSIAKIIAKKSEEVIGSDGGFDFEKLHFDFKFAVNDMGRDDSDRMVDWLVLTAVDRDLAQELDDDPTKKFKFSPYSPFGFSVKNIRGGKIYQGEYRPLVATNEELESPAMVKERQKVVGEIGGNVTVDFGVLDNLPTAELELLKAAMGAGRELKPDDPQYLAYFRNTTLGKGRIQANEVWDEKTPVIAQAMHSGSGSESHLYETKIPGVVLHTSQDQQRRNDAEYLVRGYYIIPGRLEQSGKAIKNK